MKNICIVSSQYRLINCCFWSSFVSESARCIKTSESSQIETSYTVDSRAGSARYKLTSPTGSKIGTPAGSRLSYVTGQLSVFGSRPGSVSESQPKSASGSKQSSVSGYRPGSATSNQG